MYYYLPPPPILGEAPLISFLSKTTCVSRSPGLLVVHSEAGSACPGSGATGHEAVGHGGRAMRAAEGDRAKGELQIGEEDSD